MLVFLAVLALGLSAGALVAEGAVLVPFWRSLQPESFLAWYRQHATLLLRFFGPLEIVAASLAVVAALVSWLGDEPASGLLAISAVLAVLVLAMFPLYFQRANASFAGATIATTEVGVELRRWSIRHWVRVVLAIAAFAVAVVAARKGHDRMTYLKRLQQAHRIEVNGEATYVAAAGFARHQDHRAKWQVLAKLETRMKERLAGAITSLGDSAEERKVDVRLGHAAGALLASLPWRIMLRGLRVVTGHTTRFFQRLESEHPEGDASLLAYLTAHERAQCEFAKRELEGNGEQSLEPVLKLLGAEEGAKDSHRGVSFGQCRHTSPTSHG